MSLIRSFCLFAVLGASLGLLAQSTPRERIATHLKAVGTATSDTAQDRLSLLIEKELRGLLDADDALTASFTDLPMTRVDAPDGAFRMFTWNLPRQDGSHQYRGFLVARTKRGQSLFELRDMTAKIPSPEVPELGPDRWYGALYYEVIPVEKGSRTFYTLLGWKGYTKAETRKVIEVLSFKNDKPRFGAPLFGSGKLKAMRKIYGFSFQSTMTLRYDPQIEGIVMDHLSPSRADMKDQPAFYGPDMTHDAYFWHKGEWWFGPDIDLRDTGRIIKPFNAPKKR